MRGPRASRLALALLVAALPAMVTSALIASLFRATLFDYFPGVSDELAYYHQIDTFVRAGFGGGYFTFYEISAPLPVTHFGVHGPAFPVMYGLLGRLVGWQLYSGPMFNLAVLAASTLVFIGMTRLSRAQIVTVGAVLLTSWWVILMASITMQETLNQAFMVVMAAFAARLVQPDPEQRGTLLVLAVLVLAAASVLRPTNWIIAIPLVVVGLNSRRRVVLVLALLASIAGIPLFWLLWRYISAPIPGLAIELSAATGEGAVSRISSYVVARMSGNASSIFDLRSFVAQPFFQHAIYESVAIAAISTVLAAAALARAWASRRVGRRPIDVWRTLSFRVDLFNVLALGTALGAFFGFYFDSDASISRVTAPFLLFSLLLLVATRCRTSVLAAALAANALVAPSFVTTYSEWRKDLFTYDRAPYERFRGQIASHIVFDGGQGPWCNTLLTMTYPREILGVPAGVGLSMGGPPENVDDPVKSKYLLLTGDGPAQYGARLRLEHVATTDLGDLYQNSNASCE